MKFSHYMAFLVMVAASQALITILHELGHGLMASVFTRNRVKVFLGSHGETENSAKIKVGKLDFYIKTNIFKWRGGLCISEGNMSFIQYAMYILAGTIVPLIAGLISLIVSIAIKNEYIYGFSVIFLIMSTISLVRDLYPRKNAVKLHTGVLSPNDGYLLKELFRYKNSYAHYVNAINLYNEKKYEQAAEEFFKLINRGLGGDDILSLFISAAMLAKKFKIAEDVIEKYTLEERQFNSGDYINIGYYYSNVDQHEEALRYYYKSLESNESWIVLNNIGYSLIQTTNYKEAINYLDRAITIEDHAYSYNNRGLAKIKLGNEQSGLKDLQKGHLLDPNNSYYFKNMGIYHFDREEYSEALTFFNRAKELDPDTYKIDEDIENAGRLAIV